MLTSAHSHVADALSGAVVLPGDHGWDEARSGFNLLEDQHPAAVAFPVDADDVAAAVAYARRAGLRVAPQATGHNQGPLGDMDGTLLLNVNRLQDVRVDPAARQVRVDAGVKWDRVAPRLSAHGLAGLHGSSPDVGIAGYSLGGGMGWLARKHGLQTNAVTALELVTADGSFVRADHEHHADLFWALRGGGGNFGVVTAIEFAVHPVEELYAGALFFPFERSPEVLHTWNELQGELPDELMTWASLLHFPPIPDVPAFARGRSFAVIMAAFLGAEAEGRALLRPLRELPADALDEILTAVGPGSGRGQTLTMLQFRQMGGALGRLTYPRRPRPRGGRRHPGIALAALLLVWRPGSRSAVGAVAPAVASVSIGRHGGCRSWAW